jgi:ankyrin repeat protein
VSYKADPNLKDNNNRNSLHWAINCSPSTADASFEIEDILIVNNVDYNAVDNRGRTALHYCFVKIGNPFDVS